MSPHLHQGLSLQGLTLSWRAQVKDAMSAVSRLHERPVSELQTPLQPHSRPVASQASLWARQVMGEGQHWKKWRLILRNLAFKARTLLPPVFWPFRLHMRCLLEQLPVWLACLAAEERLQMPPPGT